MLELTVKSTISEKGLIKAGDHVIVGLSGGADSVSLLTILCELSSEWDFYVHPVHINHHFRQETALRDQKFSVKYSKDLSKKFGQRVSECKVFDVNCIALAKEKNLTSEEAGRLARYDSFKEVARELIWGGAAKENIKIAVAHNADDQAETVLFRILRGTGVDGLSGIPFIRTDEEGFTIVRPLLNSSRDSIEDFIKKRGLSYCQDETNSEAIYARNKIRLELIPALKEYNTNIIEALNRLSRNAATDSAFLLDMAEKMVESLEVREKDGVRYIGVSADSLAKVPEAIRPRVYVKIFAKLGLVQDVTSAHIYAIERVRLSKTPSSSCPITGGYKVQREYGKLIFMSPEIVTVSGKELINALSDVKIKLMSLEDYLQYRNKGTIHGVFSADELVKDGLKSTEELVMRKRRDGDYMWIGLGRKKLQDIFVDEKIPKEKRDDMIVLAFENQILWILPSPYFSMKTNKKHGRFTSSYKIVFDNKTETTTQVVVVELPQNL